MNSAPLLANIMMFWKLCELHTVFALQYYHRMLLKKKIFRAYQHSAKYGLVETEN